MISSKVFERWLISITDMPTPGSDNISSRACSKTGTGITAGPALKLKIRSVMIFIWSAAARRRFGLAAHRHPNMHGVNQIESAVEPAHSKSSFLEIRPHDCADRAQNQRARHHSFSLNRNPVGPSRDYGTLSALQRPQRHVDHLLRRLADAPRWPLHPRRRKETGRSHAGAQGHHFDAVRPVLFPQGL